MPRPVNKQQLIFAAAAGLSKLWALINSMPSTVQNADFAFEDRDKNLRDVLVHLFEWHRLLLNWVRENMAGRPATFLPPPYNWTTYPTMNIELWAKHQRLGTSLSDAKSMLQASHVEVMQLIEGFTNDELFTKKYFTWSGSTSLGAYCVSATASHYEWAMKKLKMHLRTR